jgi:hypothetical protein
LALSLILISVVKTAEIFIVSDKELRKKQERFISATRKTLEHRNEKGNISLIGATFTVILSGLLLFFITKMQLEYREAVYRQESYLCFGYLNKKTKDYITEMSRFNIALRTAFAARNTVVNGVEGEAIFKTLALLRDARHLNYMKNISFNKYCHLPETIFYLEKTPFELTATGTLATNIDETSIVREKKWTNQIVKIPHAIRLKKAFCLTATFEISGAFFPDVKMASAEAPLTDLSNLKC